MQCINIDMACRPAAWFLVRHDQTYIAMLDFAQDLGKMSSGRILYRRIVKMSTVLSTSGSNVNGVTSQAGESASDPAQV